MVATALKRSPQCADSFEPSVMSSVHAEPTLALPVDSAGSLESYVCQTEHGRTIEKQLDCRHDCTFASDTCII